MTVIKTQCEHCKKDFNKSISEYNKSLRLNLKHFCSRSCSAKYNVTLQRQNVDKKSQEYYLNPNRCKNCHRAISYENKKNNKFCGHSCSAIFNNIERSEKRICIFCGKGTKNQRFCNKQCFSDHKIQSTKKLIEQGKKVKDKTFKRYLVEKNGHKCQMCGIIEWGGKPVLLILDHVNGNSEDCSFDNLRLICSNCDTLTPTYKGRNKGNGRHLRKQRYSEGKSF